MSEWLRAQLVAGLRRGPEYPIPPIDHPGCANGTVSRRHWLTWQQANSVSVFEIQLLRDIVAILARAGIEPVNSWLTQQTHTAAIGGHKALLEATGDPNGAYLTSYITLARGAIDNKYLAQRVVPALATQYPFIPIRPLWPRDLETGPYDFRLGIREHQPRLDDIEPHHARLVITSPIYYCRYYSARWPGTVGDRNWPLAPADERTPIVYPNKPHLDGLTRQGVEDARATAVATITDWTTFLDIELGEFTTPVWQDVPDGQRYLITAPAALNNDLDTLWHRAQPYSELDIIRDPAAARRLKRPVITIHTHSPLQGEITDSDGDYQLSITSAPLA